MPEHRFLAFFGTGETFYGPQRGETPKNGTERSQGPWNASSEARPIGKYNKLSDDNYLVPTCDGDLYISSRINDQVKGDFEDWLEGRARKRVFEMRRQKRLDAQEYKDSQRAVVETIASGAISWGSEAWLAAIQSPEGAVELILILATRSKKNVDPVTTERLLKVMEDSATAEAIGECIKEILEDNKPNFLNPPRRGVRA